MPIWRICGCNGVISIVFRYYKKKRHADACLFFLLESGLLRRPCRLRAGIERERNPWWVSFTLSSFPKTQISAFIYSVVKTQLLRFFGIWGVFLYQKFGFFRVWKSRYQIFTPILTPDFLPWKWRIFYAQNHNFERKTGQTNVLFRSGTTVHETL